MGVLVLAIGLIHEGFPGSGAIRIAEKVSAAYDRLPFHLFVIDPLGANVLNPNRDALVPGTGPLDPLLDYLIGESKRSLKNTFDGDTVEHRKIMKFFD